MRRARRRATGVHWLPMPAVSHAASRERPTLTKIVATVGPASESPDALRRLALAGVSVFRLNFSHGTMEEHGVRLQRIRKTAADLDLPLAVLGDLCGPKIRVGRVPAPGIEVQSGEDILLRPGEFEASSGGPGDTAVFAWTYAGLANDVRPGARVLINDGAIRTLAVEPAPGDRPGDLRCRVTIGGLISSGKGVNLPDTEISLPAMTEEDRRWVAWAVEHDLDFLALSFVRTAQDVGELRILLSAAARGTLPVGRREESAAVSGPIPVIAKIEKPQALTNIGAILEQADGIMVARGDLGVELDAARVPIEQKMLIARAREFGKPCIVATQMLETMIEKPMPTRAEASDVANAIFDGADAVMLSAETAAGKHPTLVVETMRRIALATEEHLRGQPRVFGPPERLRQAGDIPAAVAHGAWTMYDDMRASLVVVWSEGGGTARRLSQNSFQAPILAFSADPTAVRRMALLRGVIPVFCQQLPQHRSEFAALADRYALEHGLIRPGETMVLVGGKPFGVRGTANTVAVRVAGELTLGGGVG